MPKPLLPTLKERNRYLVFELISDSKVDRDSVIRAIWNSSLTFLGELGTSKSSLWLTEWDSAKGIGILKVNHKAVDKARAALALVKEINKKPCIIHVLGISGTIKKAKEKWILKLPCNFETPDCEAVSRVK